MSVEPVCLKCGYYMVQDHAGNWYCEGPDDESSDDKKRVTQRGINDHAQAAWLTEDMEDDNGEPWGV